MKNSEKRKKNKTYRKESSDRSSVGNEILPFAAFASNETPLRHDSSFTKLAVIDKSLDFKQRRRQNMRLGSNVVTRLRIPPQLVSIRHSRNIDRARDAAEHFARKGGQSHGENEHSRGWKMVLGKEDFRQRTRSALTPPLPFPSPPPFSTTVPPARPRGVALSVADHVGGK
jgi:hypothetical protein